jgi:3-oxoacyl-[acyl-carrier protein] reductase
MAKVPLGRMGTPAEIGSVLGLLVSDGGAYVNCQMLQVNGGGQT